ncbi:MAG: PmoA family protein, partial [Maribacter sp.]|nr:PmoA family protein [Maribacter sp.]
ERDYFMNWKESHWKKISAKILEEEGPVVRWQTEYGLLDENGKVILTEVQEWSMQESDGGYILDLEWKGNAKIDITLGEFYVGGLFLRMPWKKGDIAAIINSNGQNNLKAEGQRAIWTDLGVQVEGRNDMAHIAILDHPDNRAFPTPWRVDTQFGFGPSIQILGDWKIKEAETEIIKYRLIIYTGDRDKGYISRAWKELVCRD